MNIPADHHTLSDIRLDRSSRIESLFLRLVASRSDTNTCFEGFIEEIILNWLKSLDYFRHNPENLGTRKLFHDHYQREVIWALVKGKGSRTIVLLHHHDTVDIEDFGRLKDCAFRPDELREALSTRNLGKAVRQDLESNEWIFGRGTADMKSGAAIQLNLLNEFSMLNDFDGNILLISVPDEEAISRGMLAATELMCDIRNTFHLEYILAVNSEPYFNNTRKMAVMYEGSVGKVMPVVYVRGVRCHIGEPYNGINPSLILANIQSHSELNVKLCDRVGHNATPPPVWVNLKDRKKAYDASIPEAATGYFNWLTFTRTPVEIMAEMNSISQKAMQQTLERFHDSYKAYCKLTGDEPEEITFEPRVLDYRTLHQEALLKGGADFIRKFEEFTAEIDELLKSNAITLPEASIRLLEFTADAADLEGPAVVTAISGPYYPHVSNALWHKGDPFDMARKVNEISMKNYGVEYLSVPYFMGISDLSYLSWTGNDEDITAIRENSPGWDSIYRIPFNALQSLKMPVVNIGPWGKDLHKPTERVFRKDVYERIPEILHCLISDIFTMK
ncbi:MAG: hypothetical protein CVV64_19575 [Candidatus Wallbacteria bacterium HGW-Wallbacteria-1]|uniref:Arginine utilization protein RocB n=1 Tax=Candidatus Wallbacteria bacterium HGW-Wallbacteria-1 TaxID=2013854 RepID=A0A2N1PJ05_9BACT|nr:MAG: hypothetical protein CVV64_19575 [Candidatus Wallbacteria bacterium HGW-Wallbacteria-1]